MTSPQERIEELLLERALWGLDPETERELARLEGDHGSSARAEDFDLLAAQIHRGCVASALEPMPSTMRARLLDSFPLSNGSVSNGTSEAWRASSDPSAGQPQGLTPEMGSAPGSFRVGPLGWFGWAAAAALAAFVLWQGSANAVGTGEAVASIATVRAAIAAVGAPIEWSPTEDPLSASASGDVVWDTERQQGVMRFRDLPANDPSVSQYQLWIFDKTRPDAYPVDGGVFDVAAGAEGDVLVPFVAKIEVRVPDLFAITLEAPGGVVVSTRERLLLTAAR